MPPLPTTLRTLYLHFPFCARICPFCAFTVRKDRPAAHDAYGAGLLQELRLRLNAETESLVLDSLYLGGGTPSRMTGAELEWLFFGLRQELTIAPHAEVAFELNPEDVAPNYLSGLQELGITRLSLGGQSFHDETLQRLGRVHDVRQLRKALEVIQESGFQNWNLDLMFGVPGQSHAQFLEGLTEAIRWQPTHVSLYGLEVHDATPFSRDTEIQSWVEGHHPEVTEMYLAGVEQLAVAGLQQYEVSNFARLGSVGRQNLRVWDGEPYLGLGTGAHSFVKGSRWGNVRSLQRYLGAVNSAILPEAFREIPDRAQRASEWLMLQLRRLEGIDLEAWRDHFAIVQPLPHGLLERLHNEGRALWNPPRFRLTPSGFLIADSITAQLLPEE